MIKKLFSFYFLKMNVNQMEIYDHFVKQCILNEVIYDNISNEIKNFILNNNVNELILEYEKVIFYSETLNNTKYKEELFMTYFYESITNYIMKNNFSTINNIKNIFVIFPYISTKNMYELITYLYPLVTDTVQEYFHYELINILYAIMVNKESINSEHYYDLLNKLYNHIIKNPLYTTKDEKKDKEYHRISLFDLFAHISYVLEKYDISFIFLKLIMNQMEVLNNEVLLDFFRTTVNINSLYTLYENIDVDNNNNYEYISNIEKDEKETNIYVNTITYFIAKMSVYTKNTNFRLYHFYEKDITYYVTYYFEEILNKRDNHYFNIDIRFIPDESVHIIGDLFRLNNNNFYELFIDSFNKSIHISKSTKVFMLNIWVRYIYYIINKYSKHPVSCDVKNDTFYINKRKILKTDYINDIVTYLHYVKEKQRNVYDFLIENMKQFVYYDYEELIEKCKCCEEKCCSICLENVEDMKNMNICLYCNKLFHDSCIIELWKSNNHYCPLCRKNINASFYTYVQVRYDFMKDILDAYDA